MHMILIGYPVFLVLMYVANMFDNIVSNIFFWILFFLSCVLVINVIKEIRMAIIVKYVNFSNRNVDIDEWERRNSPQSSHKEES